MVLGMGGTIAGTSPTADDSAPYKAAQLSVGDLLQSVPGLEGVQLAHEQVAQVDSKDMDFGIWRRLAERASFHLARSEVAGLVVTHGSDTLEETAYFLQRVLASAKPVVLTASMRPASSAQADGPHNLRDAVRVAGSREASGVVAVLRGAVHGALDVRKVHTSALDAFSSGAAGPIASIDEAGVLTALRPWPHAKAPAATLQWPGDAGPWPWVEIITSHVGADGRLVDAALALGVNGLVVAGTGHGTVHLGLRDALDRAQRAGVRVIRCSRVPFGAVEPVEADPIATGGELSPVKARIELMLQLMGASAVND